MTETRSTYWDTPSIEVRVYRDGDLVQRELCDTEVDAAAVVDAWSEVEGVVCQVDDLGNGSASADLLDPLPWEVDVNGASFESSADDNEGERG